MDFDIIKTVLSVARTRNFSESAFELGCSQSSVSRRVELAEKELDLKIFSRPNDSITRRVQLTASGEQVIPLMKKLAEDYYVLLSLKNTSESTPVTLHVGTKSNSMPPMAFSVIKAGFYEKYPQINLDVQSNSLDKLVFDLTNGNLDAIFFGCKALDAENLHRMDHLRLRLLGKTPMSIAMSSEHPLASRKFVRMEELKDEIFLLKEESSIKIPGIDVADRGGFVSRVEKESGFTPKCLELSENMLEIRYQLVKNKKGIFPSYTPNAWRWMPGITYVPLANEDERFLNYYLLSRSGKCDSELNLFANYLTACISIQE